MIPTDITTGHPFTPSWREDEENPPRYYFRGASVIERSQIEAELAGEYGAGRVFSVEMISAFRSGLQALLADDPELDRLLELVQAESMGDAPDGDDRQLLLEARAVLQRHWPEYRALIAQQERRREIMPIILFRRLCCGWDNVSVPFSRGKDKLIPDAVLTRIDPMEMIAAGNFAYGMIYAGDEERNFPPPSPSGDVQGTSPSDGSRADGSSGTSPGPTIPASPSPDGSGA